MQWTYQHGNELWTLKEPGRWTITVDGMEIELSEPMVPPQPINALLLQLLRDGMPAEVRDRVGGGEEEV